MHSLRLLPLLALLGAPAALAAPSAPSLPGALAPGSAIGAVFTTPGVDLDALSRGDLKREREGLPPRFAQPFAVSITPERGGRWVTGPEGAPQWRLEIRSPGARSLNLGFTRFHLPPGASLRILDAQGAEALRFDEGDNDAHRQLWTPIVPGERLTVELTITEEMRPFLELELGSVNHGYRGFDAFKVDKSGSCNVDVVCAEGDEWRDEIRSVAVISTGGSTFCTGFLVNNTAEDLTPYFMTAYHCGIRASAAPSLVTYWNFEASSCGGPRDGALSTFNSGARLRAEGSASDFTLVELDDPINPDADPRFAGWSARDVDPTSAVGIHQPSTDEKAISFEMDPTSTTSYLGTGVPGDGTHVRVTDWDIGTTEPGSSGSPLFDQDHRIVGQLHGGYAACGNDDSDWYGRMAVSWGAGLSDYLDGAGTGALVLDGRDECIPPSVDIDISANPAVIGEAVVFTAEVSGGEGPYSYSWDLDGDGAEDCADATCTYAYKAFYNGDVTLRVTDAQPCAGRVSRAMVVDGPLLDLAGVGAISPLCHDGDGVFDPGETWILPVSLTNGGSIAAEGVLATFDIFGSSAPLVSLESDTVDFGAIQSGETVTRDVVISAAPDAGNCQETLSLSLQEVFWDGGALTLGVDILDVALGGVDGRAALLSEDFEAGLGAWTVTTGPGPHSGGEWVASTATRSLPVGGAGVYALADSDGAGDGSVTSTALVSPALDLSAARVGPILLEADLYFREYAGAEEATVEVLDGANWVVLADYEDLVNGPIALDISAYALGNPALQVRFNYQLATWDWWYAVDNVAITGPTFAECAVVEGCELDPDPTPTPTPVPTPTPTPEPTPVPTPTAPAEGYVVTTFVPPADLSVAVGDAFGPVTVVWTNPALGAVDFAYESYVVLLQGQELGGTEGDLALAGGEETSVTSSVTIQRYMRPGTYTYGVRTLVDGVVTQDDRVDFEVTRR